MTTMQLDQETFVYKERTDCRICHGPLYDVFDLGEQYVSAFPKPEDAPTLKAPLQLSYCRGCTLLQLRHTVNRDLLYRTYWYKSGVNPMMRQALKEIVVRAEDIVCLKRNDRVLDIGCNDGTLLSFYETTGIERIGVDPALNIPIVDALKKDVHFKVCQNYFSADLWDFATNPFKVVTSIAMFYDLDDPHAFVRDVRRVLHPKGIWVIQMSYLPSMLIQNAIDNVCHEHVGYYTFLALESLLTDYDLEVLDVELNDVNGGSMRVYVQHAGARRRTVSQYERVLAISALEEQYFSDDVTKFERFQERIWHRREALIDFLRRKKQEGKTIYVYGASTKGNTLLQTFGIDNTLITAAAERSPEKWGRVTVGTNIPIVSEEAARGARPDYFLVLPWHFIESFKQREAPFLERGGQFILPLPDFQVIGR